MKRMVCGILALMTVLAVGCALADQQVNLPGSRYTVMIPDEMIYDGPTPDTDEAFAYVDEQLGLTISFVLRDAPGLDLTRLMPRIQEENPEKLELTAVNGIPMIVYRATSDEGAKCIGYILQDGDAIQELLFWYTTQKAADMSRTIMESIQ